MKHSIIALAALSALLAGCGGSSGGSTPTNPLVAGTWRQVQIATPSASLPCPASLSGVECGASDTIEFKGGDFTMRANGGVSRGRFTVVGNVVTLSLPGVPGAVVPGAVSGGGSLSFTYTTNGVVFTDTYQKQ